MISIQNGGATRLYPENTPVIDIARQLGAMPVYRAKGQQPTDKPASVADLRNKRRLSDYYQRQQGQQAPRLQIWRAS